MMFISDVIRSERQKKMDRTIATLDSLSSANTSMIAAMVPCGSGDVLGLKVAHEAQECAERSTKALLIIEYGFGSKHDGLIRHEHNLKKLTQPFADDKKAYADDVRKIAIEMEKFRSYGECLSIATRYPKINESGEMIFDSNPEMFYRQAKPYNRATRPNTRAAILRQAAKSIYRIIAEMLFSRVDQYISSQDYSANEERTYDILMTKERITVRLKNDPGRDLNFYLRKMSQNYTRPAIPRKPPNKDITAAQAALAALARAARVARAARPAQAALAAQVKQVALKDENEVF